MGKKEKFGTFEKAMIGLIAAIVLFAVCAFLFTSNSGATGEPTGLEVLLAQGFWYNALIVVCVLIAVACAFWAKSRYDRSQEVGKMALPTVLMVVFIFLAFFQACEDKANNGVTAPKGKPASELVTPTR